MESPAIDCSVYSWRLCSWPSACSHIYTTRGTKPVAKIDLPGVSGEITKEGVDIDFGKPKN
jgi:hypothetical protein